MIGPIAGILASNVSVVREYFTTVLYPFAVTDDLSLTSSKISSGILWESPLDNMSLVPAIVSGTLNTTIAYKTYNEPLYVENMSLVPAILSGTLNETIVYKTYNEPLYVENMSLVPSIVSGTLNTTISYISYNNWDIENIALVPTIISGTLT